MARWGVYAAAASASDSSVTPIPAASAAASASASAATSVTVAPAPVAAAAGGENAAAGNGCGEPCGDPIVRGANLQIANIAYLQINLQIDLSTKTWRLDILSGSSDSCISVSAAGHLSIIMHGGGVPVITM